MTNHPNRNRKDKAQPDQKPWSQHFQPGRSIKEVHEFSHEQIEKILMTSAKGTIIGSMYVGDIGEQHVEWRDDGSAAVTTEHVPAIKNP